MDAKRYLRDVRDTDLSHDALFVASQTDEVTLESSDVTFTVSLVRKRSLPGELYFDRDEPVDRKLFCRLRFYSGGSIYKSPRRIRGLSSLSMSPLPAFRATAGT